MNISNIADGTTLTLSAEASVSEILVTDIIHAFEAVFDVTIKLVETAKEDKLFQLSVNYAAFH